MLDTYQIQSVNGISEKENEIKSQQATLENEIYVLRINLKHSIYHWICFEKPDDRTIQVTVSCINVKYTLQDNIFNNLPEFDIRYVMVIHQFDHSDYSSQSPLLLPIITTTTTTTAAVASTNLSSLNSVDGNSVGCGLRREKSRY
ncbi:hypothetical protein ACTFIW_003725 [Dictyostelium discoideum]